MNEYIYWMGLLFIWLILTLIVINFAFHFLSIASTTGNIVGLTIFMVWIVVSFITKCFTKFYKK